MEQSLRRGAVAGQSNGCTIWSATNADEIGVRVANSPTTLCVYPEAADVRAAAAGGGYWAASCRAEIGASKF